MVDIQQFQFCCTVTSLMMLVEEPQSSSSCQFIAQWGTQALPHPSPPHPTPPPNNVLVLYSSHKALCGYHFGDCLLKIWPVASGKASYFIIVKLTSIPQLYYTLVYFLANPSNPKFINDISWREMGKWLKISQQMLHSTCNIPLH